MSAQGYRRQSWEILKDLAGRVGAKSIAYHMRLNLSLIYEWVKDPESVEDMMSSGKRNPLDRVRELLHLAVSEGQRDLAVEIINWFGAEVAGVYLDDKDLEALKRIVDEAEKQAKGRGRART